MSLKVDLARKYRKKHGMDMPTLKLARIMYNDHKLTFTDVEDARNKLRYIAGKRGAKEATNKVESEFFEKEERPRNPYKLPESDETVYDPFILKNHKRIAIFCDPHAPYHSVQAITAALAYCKKDKVDALLINGDGWDFHGISHFMTDPSKKKFHEEIQIGADLFNRMRQVLDVPLYYKLGNHCERYQHFLWQKAKEIIGLDEFKLEEIIEKRIPGTVVISGKTIIKANDLNIVHGHEFASSIMSPVNIARGLYLRAKANTICGHHHRSSEHTEQDINGKMITTWSIGCMSELHPQYMPINSWNHGFAIVDLFGDKDFEVRNKRIWKGKIL